MENEAETKICCSAALDVMKCTICSDNIVDPMITPCSHTFCANCILEVLDKKKACPQCKKFCVPDQLIKNYNVGRLISHIQTLKTNATRAFLENMFSAANNAAAGSVSKLFYATFKDAALLFERHCAEARRELDIAKKEILKKQQLFEDLNKGKAVDPTVSSKMKEEQGRKLAKIEEKYQRAVGYLLEVFNKHLSEVVPDQKKFPLKINILFPSRKVSVENIYVAPTGSFFQIQKILEEHFASKGDPIVSWGSDIEFLIFNYVPKPIGAFELGKANSCAEVRDGKVALCETPIFQGSTVLVIANVLLETEVVRPCITYNFKPEEKRKCNYFVCTTCGLNWVCDPCIKNCHKGHTYIDFMKSHTPSWACCYCSKKNCTLLNKNSKSEGEKLSSLKKT